MSKVLVLCFVSLVACTVIDRTIQDRNVYGALIFILGFAIGTINEVWITRKSEEQQ